jgi:hypothetical protein
VIRPNDEPGAIKDRNQVKMKCEVEYTPFLSLLCAWRFDGLRGGQPGLDSEQGQNVRLLQNVLTGSGAHPASYTGEYQGPFLGGWETMQIIIIFI